MEYPDATLVVVHPDEYGHWNVSIQGADGEVLEERPLSSQFDPEHSEYATPGIYFH
jgi:hypothetical protein